METWRPAHVANSTIGCQGVYITSHYNQFTVGDLLCSLMPSNSCDV